MSTVPTSAAQAAIRRYTKRCAKCGLGGRQVHHRRSRGVVDAHTHCPCNLLLLCGPCHAWAHSHPTLARAQGFIVSRYERRPGDVLLQTAWGPRLHECRS